MIMAGEKLPILSMAIPAFETFMTRWEGTSKKYKKHPILHKAIETGLTFARKYYGRMDKTDAYVVAMGKSSSFLLALDDSLMCFVVVSVIHPGLRMSWIEDEWDKEYIEDASSLFKKLVRFQPAASFL